MIFSAGSLSEIAPGFLGTQLLDQLFDDSEFNDDSWCLHAWKIGLFAPQHLASLHVRLFLHAYIYVHVSDVLGVNVCVYGCASPAMDVICRSLPSKINPFKGQKPMCLTIDGIVERTASLDQPALPCSLPLHQHTSMLTSRSWHQLRTGANEGQGKGDAEALCS